LKKITAFLLCIYSPLALAQEGDNNSRGTYLCIAEHASYVTTDGKGKLSSDSGTYEKKYIITPNKGLKEFGEDYIWLSKCSYTDSGRLTLCKDPGENTWAGDFRLGKDNVFVVNGIWAGFKENKEKRSYFWVIGKCSLL